MSNQDMLKIAFERGLREVVDRLEITTPDADLVKEAIYEKMWGGLKNMFRRGSKEVAEGAPKLEKLVAPAKPGGSAARAELNAFNRANVEYSAKQLERAGFNPVAGAGEAAKFTEKIGPEGQKWLKTMEGAGSSGGLGGGFGPAGFVLPTAAGAGLGYAVDGREGALMGAGLGAGARLGASGLVQRLREAKGFTSALGRAPVKGMMGTSAGKKALMASGVLGAGLGGAGYAAGQATKPPEQPWYSGMGLGFTPQQTQEVGQMAMPLLSERLGLDPSVVQALGAQYGLVPTETPVSAEQPAEYYPDEAMQQAPSEYGHY
jgi:hypothetical protein